MTAAFEMTLENIVAHYLLPLGALWWLYFPKAARN
jgi:hypothetical protein